ncbi:hypothetical protein [Pseudobacteriovorax antillogorgiicola]|uniref:Uncharacterized protein n=1 Tax=Pseudobacteriovorax antillogorgiicola TaxID=1513793 RepID=A0A1Y6CE53_9BACT|nr:hypothetical protein [Pseudobacteriovorax antillogorgiicola]TCS48300.1 hypothetical protein EDD56_11880 [Pseudobacteriovorax antillogorgiicola]SMF56798.1 hypothetical protein SAMN06296036_11861 [Pseudobacteriovorax antillogorgiicola]
MVKHTVATILLFSAVLSCNDEKGTRTDIGNTDIGTAVSATNALARSISPSALSETELFSSDSADNNCTEFSVTVADEEGAGLEGAEVEFSVTFSGGDDSGTLNPELGTTSAGGQATTTYCSGLDLGEGTIIAAVNELRTNSETFTVSKKGSYSFAFVSSSIPALVETDNGQEGNVEESIIPLNLIDSGPQDCTTLVFELSKDGTAIPGRELKFYTQDDPPRGLKLAKKKDDGTFETNEETNKNRAIFNATSSSEGRFAIPFCSGVTLGSAVVSASFNDEDGQTVTASSPVISIRGGVTNYANFSLTFDTENARTLKGYFNTNSTHTIKTAAKVDTRKDGDAIREYPLQVVAETGKAELLVGGRANEATGEAFFTMRALHMVDYYAYRLFPFAANPDAAARCSPSAVADSLGNNAALSFSYRDLSKNWRTTVTYAINGQEHYYDENSNGIYDGGGDGFWDKNENGVFDSGIDVLTYDANNNGVFDYLGEWFIDLPTPFVDADENGSYEANRDILMGDTYNEPNGLRDSDTIIWKNEVYPIFMGVSDYSLTHESIFGDLSVMPLTNTGLPGSTLFAGSILNDDFFGIGANAATRIGSATIGKFLYAHGICGNLVPGGTEFVASTELIGTVAYGERTPIINFTRPDIDAYREPSRRFLKTYGGAEAVVNFNAVDHPNEEFGYPISFNVTVPACNSICTGDVVTGSGGVACASQTHRIRIELTEPTATGGSAQALYNFASVDEVNTCQCVTGASLVGNSCVCPDGFSSNGVACVAD